MPKQRQLFAKPRMSAAHRKALIRTALIDYPIRQDARDEKRRVRREGSSIYRRRLRQYTLPFYGNTGWETVLASPRFRAALEPDKIES